MAGDGRHLVGLPGPKDQASLRSADQGEGMDALNDELDEAIARSKARMDRVADKAELLKRALRRPNSYPPVAMMFARNRFGT
jgi:hypothetical protein